MCECSDDVLWGFFGVFAFLALFLLQLFTRTHLYYLLLFSNKTQNTFPFTSPQKKEKEKELTETKQNRTWQTLLTPSAISFCIQQGVLGIETSTGDREKHQFIVC